MNMKNFQFSIYNFQKKRGFTLIETLIAIAILGLAVAGPLYTADRAMVAAETANSQLTASYLAQEGIEYIRMVRDNNYLATASSTAAWTGFLNTVSPVCDTSCQFDPASMTLAACGVSPAAQCGPLYLSPTNIYTQQIVGTKTLYTRILQTVSISGAEEKIISTVSWNFHGTAYSQTVTDHLTPWQ